MQHLCAKISDPNFDPSDTALIESGISPQPAGGDDLGQVTVEDLDSDTLEIDANTTAPCLLLITDAYSSGWHARAMSDSCQKQYQVIPADLAFRGVPLAVPGHHHFLMIYRPEAFVIGEWITVGILVVYLATLMMWASARWWTLNKPARAESGNPLTPPTQT